MTRALGVGVPTVGQPSSAILGSNKSPVTGKSVRDQSDKPEYSEKTFQRIDVDLTTATTNELHKISGNFIWIPNGSFNLNLIEVGFDNPANDKIPMLPGSRISGVPFDKLFLTWAAQSGEDVNIIIGKDFPEDRIDTDG